MNVRLIGKKHCLEVVHYKSRSLFKQIIVTNKILTEGLPIYGTRPRQLSSGGGTDVDIFYANYYLGIQQKKIDRKGKTRWAP